MMIYIVNYIFYMVLLQYTQCYGLIVLSNAKYILLHLVIGQYTIYSRNQVTHVLFVVVLPMKDPGLVSFVPVLGCKDTPGPLQQTQI